MLLTLSQLVARGARKKGCLCRFGCFMFTANHHFPNDGIKKWKKLLFHFGKCEKLLSTSDSFLDNVVEEKKVFLYIFFSSFFCSSPIHLTVMSTVYHRYNKQKEKKFLFLSKLFFSSQKNFWRHILNSLEVKSRYFL